MQLIFNKIKRTRKKKHLGGHYSTMLKLELRGMDSRSLQLTSQQTEHTTNKVFRLSNDILFVSTKQNKIDR